MLKFGLTLLAKIEIGALVALVSNTSNRVLSATVASDKHMNNSFWGDWCRFNLSTLDLLLDLIDNAGEHGFDLVGHHLLEFHFEELSSWEGRAFSRRSTFGSDTEGEWRMLVEPRRTGRSLLLIETSFSVMTVMATSSILSAPLSAAAIFRRFLLLLLFDFLSLLNLRLDLLDFGLSDHFGNNNLHLLDDSHFNRLGNFNNNLRSLFFDNRYGGYLHIRYFLQRLNLWDNIDLNLRLGLLLYRKNHFSFSNRLIFDRQDGDLNKFLSAGSI